MTMTTNAQNALLASLTDRELRRARKLGAPVSVEVAIRELEGRKAVREVRTPAAGTWSTCNAR